MKKKYLLCSFITIVLSFTVISFLLEDKIFSELENRNLKIKTEFTLKKFLAGEFQGEYESYINDQFPLRDKWISLKAIGETLLGKIENNNIVYGKNGELFEKFITYDKERLDSNINSVNIFSEKNEGKVTTMIVPNSYEIYKDSLPEGSPLIKQTPLINEIYSKLLYSRNLNIIDELESKKDEYIFYNTDHHWTTYGAYLAYCEFIKSVNLEPVQLEDLDGNSLEEFYGTYFSKAKPINIKGDILTYYDFDNITLEVVGEGEFNSLYDYSKCELRDKYAMFLRGNNPLTIIKNEELNNGKKLLIIKDSFANSLIPFLTQNYEEIHVIDLRSNGNRLSKYIEENEFDNIFILYNFINFATENTIIRLKY